jgi:NhaP-type Na+/H+ or K+/H+ antiporter
VAQAPGGQRGTLSAVTSYETAVLVLGGLLMVGALVSGVARRSFLSLTAVFVVAGFVLGDGALGVLSFDPRSAFVEDVAITALVVILFRDGLEVEFEMLQHAWRPPLRKLVIGMPLTAGIVAVTAKAVTDLSWTEAFLVGALLSPTDPILSSAVVTNPLVPRHVRHSLNLESGLNDGLALPPVLALAAALQPHGGSFDVVEFVLQDVGLGLVFGLVLGFLASLLLRGPAGYERGEIPVHQKSLFALGLAFGIYGITVLPPHGNGLIAVYVGAIVLGIRRPDLRRAFEYQASDVVELLKLAVFVVFGALLTLGGLLHDGWAALAIVAVTLLVARPVAIWTALAGTRLTRPTKAFMAWFGPKGIATMTFSLLVLSRGIQHGGRIFHITALAVFCSIILHGLTDTPGVGWLARRTEPEAAPEPGPGRAPELAADRPA